MSYFHMRMHTIIGAKAFHVPVRDGKGWFHLAMVVRQKGLAVKGITDLTVSTIHKASIFCRMLVFGKKICMSFVRVFRYKV